MPAITLKNIPESLYRQLKKSAKEQRRSLNSEVIYRLERSLAARRQDPDEFLAKADLVRERTAKYVTITDHGIKMAREKGRP